MRGVDITPKRYADLLEKEARLSELERDWDPQPYLGPGIDSFLVNLRPSRSPFMDALKGRDS
jgi:hypothetical protein